VRAVAAVPAAGLLAGAVAGLLLPDPPFVLGFLLLFASIVGAVTTVVLCRPGALGSFVAIGFFAGGALLSAVEWQRAWRPPLRIAFEELARTQRATAEAEGRRAPEDDEAFAIVEGVLRADASPTGSGVSLNVWVDRLRRGPVGQAGQVGQVGQVGQASEWSAKALAERATGGIVVTVVGSLAASHIDAWLTGRRVRVPATLRRPSRYLDPGVPDQERALARRGTTLVGTVKSGELVEVLARGGRIDEAMARVRLFARHAIADAVGRWNAQSGAIVAAIVIGDRAGLDGDVQTRLQEAGTYHVIAISGGNIAILAGLLLGAFRMAGWLGRAAMLCAIAALVGYARLVGGGASVDRATLMAVVYLGARAFDHRTPPANTVAVAAALLVAADPLSVADPAFILTFGATLAILLVVPIVVERKWPAAILVVVSMFAASVAAEAMLFPIGATAFSRITFAGLGLNFLAIPLMGVAQIAGMAVVPIALISSTAAASIGWVAHLGASGLVRSADLVRYLPILSYRVAPPPWIIVVCYYGAGATWWVLWRRRVESSGSAEARRRSLTRRAAALAAAAAALWILIDPRTLIAPHGDGLLHATFIDVGQGDSTLLVFPRGSTMLVDAGGLSMASSFDVGDRVVAPVIRRSGFRRLDFVALTHGDPDHIGGAASILTEFRPREVWEGIPVARSEALTALRVTTESRGARWVNVHATDHRSVDGVEVVVRHPIAPDWERQKVRNDDSIVLELRWRNVSILLTGDIGRVPERIIAPGIQPARIRVIKVAHHGSLTSSTAEFVNTIRPQIAVVSAGRSNHFGHPVPEVLDRYRAAGAEVFRTDRDGAVMIDTDGTSVNVHTFTGRLLSLH
jgi:competence protein ComEC